MKSHYFGSHDPNIFSFDLLAMAIRSRARPLFTYNNYYTIINSLIKLKDLLKKQRQDETSVWFNKTNMGTSTIITTICMWGFMFRFEVIAN